MKIQNPNSSYEHESSGSLMCVPACINMILKRRNIPTYSQLEIACELGLVVPHHLLSQYPCAKTSEDEKDWGVHPQAKETSIDLFLKKKGVSLAFKYIGAHNLPSESVVDFLVDNLRQDNDIIVGYDYAAVFNDGKNVGHVSLIKSVNSIIETVELVDPEDTNIVSVQLKDLLRGVFQKKDGFWIFADSIEKIMHEYV